MRVLVCGLGSIGRRHAMNLKALGVDALVGFDPDEGRRAAFGADFGGTAHGDFETALASPVDLAVIASPNRFHMDQARRAAERGCHLFIEKPLGASTDGLEALVDTVGAKSLFCHVGSNWKFYPAFRSMKEIIDAGEIGPLAGAQVLAGHWLPDWHPMQDYRTEYSARRELGGGVVLDTHELDYMAWLMGPIEGARAYLRHTGMLESDTEDVAAMILRFEGGAVGTLQADYIQRAPRRRYNICGRDGTLEWQLGEPLRLYRASTKRWEEVPGSLETDYNAMYLAQMTHVLAGVRSGGDPKTGLVHAANVLRTQVALQSEGISV